MWFTCFDFEKKRKRKVDAKDLLFDWGTLDEDLVRLGKDKK
jgi:hypothetical protein